ncbi:MAG: HEPN domain-containing protein [Candidatus Margulisbacteria bacterium]|nr:HEPN domain-containing protein [Candidatus Margulisiibacteriota bacterium]
MSNEQKINYWLDLSNYDLDTAKAMLETGRYLYVGFMCHQSVEKILKAYFIKNNNGNPPYTHNLLKLATESGCYNLFNENQKDLIDQLDPLNIEARYPSYKEQLLKQLNKEICSKMFMESKEFLKWISNKL